MIKTLCEVVSVLVLSLTLMTICALAQTAAPRTKPVTVGDVAPDFSLSDQNGSSVKLSEARGNVPVVLVFYRGYW